MTTLELWGHITEEGKLEVELPGGLPAGEVKVVIEVPAEETKTPRRSLEGLWAGQAIDISAEDIDEARQEMWSNFPREDIA